MSKKYEHRIKSLKDHKDDKGKKRHNSKPKSYAKGHKLSNEKKNFEQFRKKLEKSKKIW